MPGSALKTIPLTWPFAVWGLDMVGKFKTAPGGYTHLLVAVDKFTKWVEAKPIKKSGCWAEELPSVLWGIRTTPNRSTGFTPFFLVYGAEAVMPTDIAYDSPWVTNYAEEYNERARQDDIDLLDEARDLVKTATGTYSRVACPTSPRATAIV
ncbi:uncharacterized protein [Lolium perenne]|uniref:uncharacterized protein n=1 Tax=Lolium perenne TaxID=4522 RepID=UPI003A993B47